MRPHRFAALAVPVLFLLVACSDSGVHTEPVNPSQTTSSSSPSSTIDPRALPAVDAYAAYLAASQNAERDPVAPGQEYPTGADFRKFSFDPIQAQFETYIWSLAVGGTHLRGTPPRSHPDVVSVDLTASPWPTVTISDCQTGDQWLTYSTKTGKPLPGPTPSVAPPYRSEAKVIFYRKHWGVQSIDLDTDRTCTP